MTVKIRKNPWLDPDYRAKMTLKRQAAWHDPKRREKHAKEMIQRWSDPNYHEKVSSAIKSSINTEEWKKRKSLATKRNWDNNIYKSKLLPIGTIRFNTGRNRFQVKMADNVWLDQARAIMSKHLGRDLVSVEHVHHINGDQSDDRLVNLVLLHQSRHRSLHSKGRKRK